MPGQEPSVFVQLVGHLAEGVGVAVGPPGVPLGVADSLYSGAGGIVTGTGVPSGLGEGAAIGVSLGSGVGNCSLCKA